MKRVGGRASERFEGEGLGVAWDEARGGEKVERGRGKDEVEVLGMAGEGSGEGVRRENEARRAEPG